MDMKPISLARALKVQKRLAGRYSEIISDIQTYNSVLEEQKNQVNVSALLIKRAAISEAIVALKIALYKGNQGIQLELYTLAERKGEIDVYRNLNTRQGVERHGYQNTTINYVATVTKEQADARVHQLEAEVDALQEKIDNYNHSTKIEIPQSVLDLAS